MASLGARTAVYALIGVVCHPVDRYLVEETVDRSERTYIFAKWSSYDQSRNKEYHEKDKLPVE